MCVIYATVFSRPICPGTTVYSNHTGRKMSNRRIARRYSAYRFVGVLAVLFYRVSLEASFNHFHFHCGCLTTLYHPPYAISAMQAKMTRRRALGSIATAATVGLGLHVATDRTTADTATITVTKTAPGATVELGGDGTITVSES